MVGEGPLLEAARAEATRLGVNVTFPGFRHDASRVSACFDVHVGSSLYEGLGRALCEAMASGRPVVATSVNGMVDIVETGSTQLLAAPRDPEGLARNVLWFLDRPEEARRVGEAGRARVRACSNPPACAGSSRTSTKDCSRFQSGRATANESVTVVHRRRSATMARRSVPPLRERDQVR